MAPPESSNTIVISLSKELLMTGLPERKSPDTFSVLT